ncbi:MAG: hypothetical protein FWE14_09330 [Lachnospiraceae bacterium]|nr:hypothetical protein [Lachnospiraceae bacterium]
MKNIMKIFKKHQEQDNTEQIDPVFIKVRRIILSLVIFSVLILSIGTIGNINDNKRAQEWEITKQAMLKYLYEKYGQTFTEVEFIPAPQGFNTSHYQSILVTKSPEGFYVNVRESNRNRGEFWDNYFNALAAWYFDKEIDYSMIENLSYAKTHIIIFDNDLDLGHLNELRENVMDFLSDKDTRFNCLIAIKTTLSESDLDSIYQVYQQLEATNHEFSVQIAFSANDKKSEEFVENYPLYITKIWEEFAPKISHYAYHFGPGLSLNEFSDAIINWEDKR